MNRIKTSDVSDPSIQQPFTARSLDFLQDANKEVVSGIALGLIGKIYDPARYYLIGGLTSYGSNQFTDGYVFFNGELYFVKGKTNTSPFTNIPVLTIDTNTSIGAPYDPLIFTDGVSRNAHFNRRFNLIDAIAGSGTVDLQNCIYINRRSSYSPVLKAYAGGGAEVVGGFSTGGYGLIYFVLDGAKCEVVITGDSFSIAAGVRKLEFSLPLILAGLNIGGVSNCTLQYGGTTDGLPLLATVGVTGGTGIIIENILNNTDIPTATANGQLRLHISLSIN
ncbi:MAG: hypothetical protein ABI241_00550 [Bacteroidia bacterium]